MPKFTPKSPSTAQYLRASNAKLFEMQTVLLTKPRSERAELKKEIEALDSEIRNKERESLSKHIDGSQLGSSSELWNRAKAPLDGRMPATDGSDGFFIYDPVGISRQDEHANWLDHRGHLSRSTLSKTSGIPPTVWIARHAEPLVGKCGSGRRLEDEFEVKCAKAWLDVTMNPVNPPLTRRGRTQAKELGDRLVGEGIIHIYCSPFLRAVQTAEVVSKILNIPFRVENGLSEWLLPHWYPEDPRPQLCGMSMHEVIPNCDPEYVPLYDTGQEDVQCKEDMEYPENTSQFAERLSKTVEHLLTEAHGPNGLTFGGVLMITHYSSLDKILSDLISGDSRAGWDSDPMGDKSPPLAGLVKLQCRKGWNGEIDVDTAGSVGWGADRLDQHAARWGICAVDHNYLTTGDLCDMSGDSVSALSADAMLGGSQPISKFSH